MKDRLGFSNAFGISSRGKSDDLFIYFWKEEKVLFSLVFFSQYHIYGDVISENNNKWHFVSIYRWSEEANKHQTWDLLRHLCDNVDVPIAIGGDFNELL